MANEKPLLSLTDVARENDFGFNTDFCAVGNNLFGFGSGSSKGAMMFSNVNIGQGETINFAEIKYKYDAVGTTGSWKFKVYGIDQDDVTDFTTEYPFSKTKTSASITVDEGHPTTGGTKTLNVKDIIQEIVNRSGWSRYNSIAFLLEDNGSSDQVYAYADNDDSYLVYRIGAEPNFTPTPSSVSAPSIPAAGDVGMKFSKPGVSVFDATDEELHLTTRKRVPMILMEDLYEADAAETVTIAHNLGYVPRTSVYALTTGVSDPWVRLPISNNYADDVLYFVDDTNLYLHSSETGQKFYYRIFVDRLVE